MNTQRSMSSAFGISTVIALCAVPIQGFSRPANCTSPLDRFANPFAKASAHHRPIGSGAKFASDTAASTHDWNRATQFNIMPGPPYGVAMVATDAGDRITPIAPKAHCQPVKGLPAAVRLPHPLITLIKPSAQGCFDGDVVLYDRTTRIGHHLRQYDWNDGKPTAGQYRTVNFAGLGHGTRPGERLGPTATGVAAPFGLLRASELTKPGRDIEHALQLVVPSKAGCNIMLSRGIVLPATSKDGSAGVKGNNTGHIPYGGLLSFPGNVNLKAMGLSREGLRLARAIRNYGMYVVDSGGCSAPGVRADQNVTSGQKWHLLADIRKFYPFIRLVRNNDVLNDAVAGGGKPRAPNCAIDPS